MSVQSVFSAMLFIALLFFPISPIDSQVIPLLRISIENSEDHIQTRDVKEFAERLQLRAQGRIRVELYDSGKLYRDQEVISALYTGKVEMAVPGTWHVSQYVPRVSYFLLPEFFGEEKEYNYSYLTSDRGKELIRDIETELNVVVPGDWMDLGHALIFTTRRNPVREFSDLSGKTIRVAGGLMNKMRVELLGADGVIIAWSDVPFHLKKGTINGLLTTFETVKSARLWEYGLKYAFVDNEYFPQYVPMISRRFWSSLSSEDQDLIRSIWNEVAREQRMEAEKAQVEARKLAEEQGIVITYPSAEEIRKTRDFLMEYQQDLINEIIE